MAKPKRTYLAGPEVFFPAAELDEQPGEHRFFSAELFRRCVRALANV